MLKKIVLLLLYACALPIVILVLLMALGGILFVVVYQWATNYNGDKFTTFMFGIFGEIIWLFGIVYVAGILG